MVRTNANRRTGDAAAAKVGKDGNRVNSQSKTARQVEGAP